MTPQTSLTVRSSADLLAALPFMLGFHPAHSVAVVVVNDGQAVFAGRQDLPESGEETAAARYLAWIVRKQGAETAAVIGYGEPEQATPAVLATARALRRLGVEVMKLMRVTGGRYWSFADPDCPDDGWPVPQDSEVAAAATYAGRVALPDRETLVARLDPVTGDERRAMIEATARARTRFIGLIGRAGHRDLDRTLRQAGHTAVREAERRYRSGGRLRDDEVAWLGMVLVDLNVRDYAWKRAIDEEWQISLWTDVLRRVEPRYVPAPASLLSFVAWRGGQGALALAAVDRALDANDGYGMALLITDALAAGISPQVMDGWPELDWKEVDGAGRPEWVTP